MDPAIPAKHSGKSTVAIIGAENEHHCAHMQRVFRKRGIEAVIIDTYAFPDSATLSLFDHDIRFQGQSIDDIRRYYVRTVFYSHPPYDLEAVKEGKKIDLDGWYSDYMSERERQSLLTSWLRYLSLRGDTVVNPVESFDQHYLKPFQLALLRNGGIPVPRTLVTNNADDLLAFRKEAREIVYKPVAGGASCKKMDTSDWEPERLKLLRNAPVLFQEYIEGDNVRVYTIGEEIISSGIIHTDEVDYRGNEKGVEKIELPKHLAEMCIKAMKLCKLKFSGIDVKIRPGGEFVFLECNPSPMFLGYQRCTKDPIDERLADFLLG